MRRRAAVAAIALVGAVNGWVLLRVASNRRGEPDATLVLTERELPIAYVSPTSESSAVALRVDVAHFAPWSGGYRRDLALDPLAWLDAEKLGTLGFDVRLPARGEDAEILVRRQLPRDAYAVVEHDGPALAAYRERLARRAGLGRPDATPGAAAAEVPERGSIERELRLGSRLLVVDVGADPGVLRQRHPDRTRYLIAPARVHAFLERETQLGNCGASSCRVRGSVSLLVDEVIVPRRLHGRLPDAGGAASGRWRESEPPRYEVVLRAGRRYEPWIEEIRPPQGRP